MEQTRPQWWILMKQRPFTPLERLRFPRTGTRYAFGIAPALILALSLSWGSVTATESPLPIAPAPTEYDRLMQNGYAAAQFRDYEGALNYFRLALALRPQDIYAQQAIFNVETYQTLQSRPPLALWIGIGALPLTLGLCGAIAYQISRRLQVQSQQAFLTEVTQRQTQYQALQDQLRDRLFTPTPLSSNVTFNPQSPLVPPELTAPSEDASMGTLIARLQSANPDERRPVIWELARRGDSRAVPALAQLMTQSDPQERDLILGALSQISGRTLRPISQALAASLRDQNPQVRRNAVRDLTRLHELMSQMNQLLTHSVPDSDSVAQDQSPRALTPPPNSDPSQEWG